MEFCKVSTLTFESTTKISNKMKFVPNLLLAKFGSERVKTMVMKFASKK